MTFCPIDFYPEKDLLLASDGRNIYGIDMKARKLRWSAPASDTPRDGIGLKVRQLVADVLVMQAFASQQVRIHSIETGTLLHAFEGQDFIQIMDSRGAMIDKDDDKNILIWDLQTGKTISRLDPSSKSISSIRTFGNQVIGVHYLNSQNKEDPASFTIWDAKSGRIVMSFDFPTQVDIRIQDIFENKIVFQCFNKDENAPANELKFSFWDLAHLRKLGDVTEKLNGFQQIGLNKFSFNKDRLSVFWLYDGKIRFLTKQYVWD